MVGNWEGSYFYLTYSLVQHNAAFQLKFKITNQIYITLYKSNFDAPSLPDSFEKFSKTKQKHNQLSPFKTDRKKSSQEPIFIEDNSVAQLSKDVISNNLFAQIF